MGILLVLVCTGLWSTSGLLIKLLAQAPDGVPALTIACYRSLIAGAIFLPLAWRHFGDLRSVPATWVIGAITMFTLMTVLFVVATTRTAAANAIILQHTAPIWVFVLSPLLLAERSRWSDGAVLLIAMAGVLVIFVGSAQDAATDVPALVCALVSGLAFACVIIALRALRAVTPRVVVCMNCLGSGLVMLPLLIASGEFTVAREKIPLLLTLSFFQLSLPYLIYSYALRSVPAQAASLLSLTEAVLNPALTFLVIGEHIPPATLLGGPLILAGVAGYLTLGWWRGRKPTLPPSPE